MNGGRGGKVSCDDPQGVRRSHLVISVRDDDQRSRYTDATTEEAQQIQRRLICPLRILDDKEGGLGGREGVKGGMEEQVARGISSD